MRRVLTRLVVVIGTVAAILGGEPPAASGPPDPEAGRALFEAKHCGRCHLPRAGAGAGPALERLRRPQGQMQLAGRLWNHVPIMFTTLDRNGLEWPRITAAEMVHLMAFLGADPGRDPAPDVERGRVALMRKGCLKCHRFRGEGGAVEPDLADRRADYVSVPAWAAAMWAHTPAMAAMATRRGVPYPRFSGDEMGDLIGFLRQATAAGGPAGPAGAVQRSP